MTSWLSPPLLLLLLLCLLPPQTLSTPHRVNKSRPPALSRLCRTTALRYNLSTAREVVSLAHDIIFGLLCGEAVRFSCAPPGQNRDAQPPRLTGESRTPRPGRPVTLCQGQKYTRAWETHGVAAELIRLGAKS
ncbi:uncharacterized protein SETTUDRAFT_31857 [Exserohilum turcica Et28A]|uniref:Uncharacterized protein n=1 Tax=Exserohilum turcicum (strain 28A) TaxID=671987 RepID=R0K8K0_EXST2|nr:uncharacterized protein SETTUDRAFT_31857 [Exserohilum turcica Et28A]EOA84597.1 hypothetical protein SETTUDRAFT_31857 [Exserohilum turcica Et28A]